MPMERLESAGEGGRKRWPALEGGGGPVPPATPVPTVSNYEVLAKERTLSTMANGVVLRNAVKSLGSTLVLDELNMAVPQGAIYGLLGASGCGKTTLLSCVVGTKALDRGDIWVLGQRQGQAGTPKLGSRVGYMPQDVALVGELTVKDCVMHFGWIYGMTRKQIETKYTFLRELLDLPEEEKYVSQLSGGQMRRASLAVALIHDPELLILDEPTVGLDPVLRQNIWDHLQTIASQGKTIIITTHYIEEARQANAIGLMRNGKLLEEGCPNALLAKYNASSVEQVFLMLCATQEGANLTAQFDDNRNVSPQEAAGCEVKQELSDDELLRLTSCDSTFSSSPNYTSTATDRTKALIIKNTLRVIRHPGGLSFTFLLPLLEIITFFLTVGGVPKNLHFGIVNEELGQFYSSCTDFNATRFSQAVPQSLVYHPGMMLPNVTMDAENPNAYSDEKVEPYQLNCTFSGLSCVFLTDFYDTIETKYVYEHFKTLSEAHAEAKKGKLVGIIHFAEGFTEALLMRIADGRETPPDVLDASQISIWLDLSDGQTAFLIQKQMYQAYETFVAAVMSECNEDPRASMVPIRFHKPVYGLTNPSYGSYVAPGVLVTLIFFLAVTVTSIIIIMERDEGVWNRTLVAGVSTNEILASHILTQGIVMAIQAFELLIVCFWLFQQRNEGSIIAISLLLLIQGLCGMCAGFLISVWCDAVTSSNFVSMGSFVPIIFLSGSIWPLEGMPDALRWFALCLPTTLATQSVRYVMEKGWSFWHPQVLLGYGATVAWITMLCIASAILLKYKGH